jgi:hypothetical protein
MNKEELEEYDINNDPNIITIKTSDIELAKRIKLYQNGINDVIKFLRRKKSPDVIKAWKILESARRKYRPAEEYK